MKLRTGFVSNSSTSSFLFIGAVFTKEEWQELHPLYSDSEYEIQEHFMCLKKYEAESKEVRYKHHQIHVLVGHRALYFEDDEGIIMEDVLKVEKIFKKLEKEFEGREIRIAGKVGDI